MDEQTTSKKRGRPAAYDYEKSLQQAMIAFWQHGYEGTSMSMLMTTMNMNKASIYAAYGSKEVLFQKAVEQYVHGPASFMSAALQQPTAAMVIKTLLTEAARMLAEAQHPAGCLITRGALACSDEAKDMQFLLSGYRKALELQLKQRFDRAQLEQDLSVAIDSAVLAKLVMTMHQGMTVQAVSGAMQSELLAIAEVAYQLIEKTYMPITIEGT